MGHSVAIPVTVSLMAAEHCPFRYCVTSRTNRRGTCAEVKLPRKKNMTLLVLIGNLKFAALHFRLDSNEEIEMHAFGFQPRF